MASFAEGLASVAQQGAGRGARGGTGGPGVSMATPVNIGNGGDGLWRTNLPGMPGNYTAQEVYQIQQMQRDNAQKNQTLRKTTAEAGLTETKAKEEELKNFIAQGAHQAAMQGGLPGVLDFYDMHSPDKAVTLRKQSEDLKNSMLDGISKQTANQSSQLELLQKQLGMLGGAGVEIAKLPANQQESAYQQMLPALQKINPSMPGTWAEGSHVLNLGLGMSVPPAQLYEAQQKKLQGETQISKLNYDMNNATDPNVRAQLGQQIHALQTQAQLDDLNVVSKQADIHKTQYGIEGSLRDDYTKGSQDFTTAAQRYQTILGLSDDLKTGNYTGSPAAKQQLLIGAVGSLLNHNVRNIADISDLANTDPTLAGLKKNYLDKAMSGTRLSGDEVTSLADAAKTRFDSLVTDQTGRKAFYEKLATDKGVTPDNVTGAIPVKTTGQMIDDYRKQANDPWKLVPDSIAAQGRAAIAQGADPDKALQLATQLAKQPGAASPQNNPPPTPAAPPTPQQGMIAGLSPNTPAPSSDLGTTGASTAPGEASMSPIATTDVNNPPKDITPPSGGMAAGLTAPAPTSQYSNIGNMTPQGSAVPNSISSSPAAQGYSMAGIYIQDVPNK